MEIIKDSILIGYILRNELDRTFMASVVNFMSHDARKDIGGRQLVIGLADQPGLYLEDNCNNPLIRKILLRAVRVATEDRYRYFLPARSPFTCCSTSPSRSPPK